MPRKRKAKKISTVPEAEQQKRWRFRLALWDEDDHKKMQNYPMLTYYCSGKEIAPTTGKVHWQTYIETRVTRLRTLFKAFPKTSFRDGKTGQLLTCDFSPEENRAYCHKDKTDLLEWGTPMAFEEKKRKVNPHWNPRIEDKLFRWQKELQKVVEGPIDRKIYWIWSEHGNAGKSTFAKHLIYHYKDTIICEGKTSDIQYNIVEYHHKKKRWPRTILIDIPRAQRFVNYIGIEKCKDLLFHSGKYEGGMVSQEGANVIVFSNMAPNLNPDKMSIDRWAIFKIPTPKNYIIPKITYLQWEEPSLPTGDPTGSQIPEDVQSEEISEEVSEEIPEEVFPPKIPEDGLYGIW